MPDFWHRGADLGGVKKEVNQDAKFWESRIILHVLQEGRSKEKSQKRKRLLGGVQGDLKGLKVNFKVILHPG